MSILGDNIRFLRIRQKLSQQKVAESMFITRGRYAKYEDGAAEPPIEILKKISKFFRISIDLLVSVDIRKYPLDEMLALPDNRILLPIKVDREGNNQIEIIPQKASMGYLSGYMDPGYIESLQSISLPFLHNGKYRAFPADGDSMPPFRSGTYIVGKYLENLSDLKPEKTYIFITTNEGISYKRFKKIEGEALTVASDNTAYLPYNIHLAELREVWEYACSINTSEYAADEFSGQTVREMFLEVRRDIKTIKNKISETEEKAAGS